MPMPSLEINNRYSSLADPAIPATRLFAMLDASALFPVAEGELSVVFVDDAEIARVHGDFMDDPTPTDVITFPPDASMQFAGEIIVSVDHARSRSKELGEPFTRELSLYLIHGWLHLAGYDDRDPSDRAAMRQAEQQALALLGASHPPIEFHLA